MSNPSLTRADEFSAVLADEDGTHTLFISKLPQHVAVFAQEPNPSPPNIVKFKCIFELPSYRKEPCEFTRDFLHFLVVERRPRTVLEARGYVKQWANIERRRK